MSEHGVMTTPIFDELLDELGVELTGENGQDDHAEAAQDTAGRTGG